MKKLKILIHIQEIRCGFPGYFPRGYIYGKSYSFGDEIYYSCVDGYELRGNPHRICNSDGKWTGLPPICIGNASNKTFLLNVNYCLVASPS